ncbi:hypothetical protein ACFOUU_25050 [Prauserella oleivorans]|uniref:hypothetical protein n=1 Tax=Prauserella oleivorans TaxID=1478153 RepID=UPI00360C7807
MSTLESKPAMPRVDVEIHYAHGGFIMRDDTYGEQDADSAAVFADDGTCIVAVNRAARGGWAIDCSDFGHVLTQSAYRRRFTTVTDAADYVAARMGVIFCPVDAYEGSATA